MAKDKYVMNDDELDSVSGGVRRYLAGAQESLKGINLEELKNQFALAGVQPNEGEVVAAASKVAELVTKYETKYQQWRQIYPACKELYTKIK